MKNTSKFLRITALLIAVVMMLSFCLVSCDEGEAAETTPAETTAAPAPDTTTGQSAPPVNPDVNVSSAAGVADLLNSNIANMIPTVPESGEQGGEQGGNNIPNMGDIADIMGSIDFSSIDAKAAAATLIEALASLSVSVENIRGALIEGSNMPNNFSLSNNFITIAQNGVKMYGKITADGVSFIGNTGDGIEVMTPVSFEEIYAPINEGLAELEAAFAQMKEVIPETSFEIDLDAIKAALTVKAEDLVDLGNGVWQLKSTYVVNALKTVLGQFGVKDADLGDAKELFDLILVTKMTADLSKYVQLGELTVKLEVPEVLTATIFSSPSAYTVELINAKASSQEKIVFSAVKNGNKVDVTFKAIEANNELFNMSLAAEQTDAGITATIKASEAGKEIFNMLLTSKMTDKGMELDMTMAANVTDIGASGNAVTAKMEIKSKVKIEDTGFVMTVSVSVNSVVLAEASYSVSVTDSGMNVAVSCTGEISMSYTASVTAAGAMELHFSMIEAGVETKADFVMNMADASGEIVKLSIAQNGATLYSFVGKITGADASGSPKFNIALVSPDGDLSFDIGFPTVEAPVLTDAEKAAFDACDEFLANYADYMAQLAEYDAQVEAAVLAGKSLGGDFALIDKTNPNVVYRYHVFVYSANDYEIFGNIEFALDTTGYNVITEADLAI